MGCVCICGFLKPGSRLGTRVRCGSKLFLLETFSVIVEVDGTGIEELTALDCGLWGSLRTPGGFPDALRVAVYVVGIGQCLFTREKWDRKFVGPDIWML